MELNLHQMGLTSQVSAPENLASSGNLLPTKVAYILNWPDSLNNKFILIPCNTENIIPVCYRSALVLDINLDPTILRISYLCDIGQPSCLILTLIPSRRYSEQHQPDYYNIIFPGNSVGNKWMLDRLPTLPGLP